MHPKAPIVLVSLLALPIVFTGCGDGERTVGPSRGGRGGNRGANVAGAAGAPVGGSSGESTSQAGVAGVATKQATPLTPNADLTITRDSSTLGVQGTWTTTVGTGSTATLALEGDTLCLSGSTSVVAQLSDGTYDYANYFGAVANLDLCRSSATDDPADTTYPLGSCPWGTSLATSFAGVRFTVAQTPTMPRELRVVFKEQGRAASAYVVVAGAGEVTALVTDASVPADASAPPVNRSNLESIQIHAFPSRRSEYPFNVCIGGLEILTGTGWSLVPDWVSEPGPGMRVQYAGVNIACAEFGETKLPGTYGTDYIYPSGSDIDIYVSAHMNVMRLPFLWERLQRTLGGEFDPDELTRLKATVDYAVGKGMTVILDPHNFGRYAGGVIGASVTDPQFADFWSRLALIYGNNAQVVFGLMNEPHDMPSTETWLGSANAAIAAIRATGATNMILVPGNAWTGAQSWTASYYGTPNATVMTGIVDAGNNFAIELHQYLDSDSSGTNAACVSGTIGSERVAAATDWLRVHGLRGFLGEFNGAANNTCYEAIDDLLTYVGDNSDVWMGWAVWAGGPWWGNYMLSVQPLNGKERPQMTVLRRHLPTQ